MERDDIRMISKKRRTGGLHNSSKVVFETKSAPTKFVDNAVYRLYFKGLVSDVVAAAADGGQRMEIAGFGVAICNETDKLLFELKERVNDPVINRKEVEIRSLIRGLSESLDLGIRNVVIYCKDPEIYQNITGRSKSKEKGVIQVLGEEVGRLRKKFDSSEATLVARDDIKLAYELAREAIVLQTSSANGDKHDEDDNDNDGDDDDDDGHDHEDDNPWAYGCGCDCDFDSTPGGFDIDSYIEHYSL